VIARALTSARLRLRAFAARDLALFRALYTDPETMRFIARPLSAPQATASFHATLLASRQAQNFRFLAIAERDGGAAIGLCSIRRVSRRARRAEVGIMLVSAARRRGYATEALATLIADAFRALPIDAVWVQYHRANAATARLFDSLGFPAADGWRPHGARPGRCVRILRRPPSQTKSNQPARGHSMSNIIGFLENAGRDAALRHASREQLLRVMQREQIEPALSSALLQPGRMAIDGLLGVRETMYCINQAIKPAKKKAPAKKKPAKKAPAKKPVKKGPAKGKR
jgi:RimJ/RimL family protein N-acetyltransferase